MSAQKTQKQLWKEGKAPHPGGRPAKTMDCLPDNWKNMIIDMSLQGCSDVAIRKALCVDKDGSFSLRMWYQLQKKDVEFRKTIKDAKDLCRAWWEEKARTNIDNRDFNSVLWFMNVKNRFAEHWRDKQEVEATVSRGTHDQFKNMTDDEILAKVKGM